MQSPNYDSRDGQSIDMLVLHYTGMQTGREALERLCEAEAKVSAHYLIEEDGAVFQLVDEYQRAWHAGVAQWRGESNINARSIGIEIVNPGHEWGYRAFPEVQMQAVLAVCRSVLSRHVIPARNVVGHSDVAPTRKDDPGELFDWPFLAEQGVGLWPQTVTAAAGLPQAAPAQRLACYGYDVSDLPAAVRAFQRHFRRELISGEWDAQCDALLAQLEAMV
jgi:N-acetylmuramoyl-L-alanine amidase